MLGYVTVAAFFYLLGFRTLFFGLGVMFGWRSDEYLLNCNKASFLTIALFVTLRLAGC